MTDSTRSRDMPTFLLEELEVEKPIAHGERPILGRSPYQDIEGRAGLAYKHD